MKQVNVTYFKPSGKFYTGEIIEISEKINGYEALFKEIPKYHMNTVMYMSVCDSGDGKEPYIVPHLFKPLRGRD